MARRKLSSLFAVGTVVAVSLISPVGRAAADPWAPVAKTWTQRVRSATPADRYEMAGGCYAVSAGGAYVVKSGGGYAATGSQSAAAPFYFKATDLGTYLLYDADAHFLAASEGALATGAYAVTGSTPGRDAGGVTYENTDAAADAVAHSDANAASGRGASIVAAAAPSELADWTVDGDGNGFTLKLAATQQSLSVAGDGSLTSSPAPGSFDLHLLADSACAAFPEVDINVDGPVYGSPNSFDEVRGFMDLHLHMMAFEFLGGRARCGKPWDKYGVTNALKDCSDSEPNGYGAVMEQVLTGKPRGYGTDGWPTFKGWPRYDSLTHEQVYYRWLERAWRGGLRLATVLLVDNHALCTVYPFHSHDCNEMNTIRLEAKRLHQLQDYIDAQSGGPGRGWFRIVEDPFEARATMNDGRLAIIPGIETSIPLDCGIMLDIPTCTADQIAKGLDEVYNDLGVRQMLILNKFDNAFSGVAGDSGPTGIIVNQGNKLETGNYWRMETCSPAEEAAGATDNLQYDAVDQTGAPADQAGRDTLAGKVLTLASHTGVAPVYPAGPHCNAMGLTSLGETMLQGMIDHHMIFDPDHMSARGRRQALNFMKAETYSGVISSHSWGDDPSYATTEHMGGVVTPMASTSTSFVAKWRKYKSAWIDPRYRFGLGWGSDMNGFATQGAPRNPTAAQNPVVYPFRGFPFTKAPAGGDVIVDKQHSGQRTFDINTDGVAHYGMYPDWVEDLRKLTGSDAAEITEDLEQGPEAYLEMWERALGIRGNSCASDVDDITDAQQTSLTGGLSPQSVLWMLGQPSSRINGAFTYCMTGARTLTLHFAPAGLLTSWVVSS